MEKKSLKNSSFFCGQEANMRKRKNGEGSIYKRKDVYDGGDVEAEEVHQEKEQEESGEHDPELFREKAFKYFGAVIDDFVFSSVIAEQMAHADRRQKKEQPDDKVRIVSCRFGKVQCQI